MESANPAAVERRHWPRQTLLGGMAVELRLTVPGAKPAVLLTRGVARDISCGGINCAVDLAVQAGTQVSVRFSALPDGVSVAPTYVSGQVVRAEMLGGAPGRIAIAFAKPLAQLEFNGKGSTADSPTSPCRQSRRIEDIMGSGGSTDHIV